MEKGDPISAGEKGEEAEKKVFLALEELEKEKLIKKFGRSFPFSQEDRRGIDFLIITNKGKTIRLQAKSSFNEEELKRYRKKRNLLYCSNRQ